jgi:hypothetical protein
MFGLSVDTDIAKLAAALDEAARRQIPFATAVALTRLAKSAQAALQESLGEFFTIRGTWVPRSIRVTPARKGSAPVAVVGSLYGPMQWQAEGASKGPRAGSAVAIPKRARPTTGARTTPSKWPAALDAKPNFFVAPLRFRAREGVFERVGRGRRQLRLWWSLAPSVRIPRRWPFEGIVRKDVGARVAREFFRALTDAMRTARG